MRHVDAAVSNRLKLSGLISKKISKAFHSDFDRPHAAAARETEHSLPEVVVPLRRHLLCGRFLLCRLLRFRFGVGGLDTAMAPATAVAPA